MSDYAYLRYIIAGQLYRDFILPVEGRPALDVPGGGLIYAAVGLRIWDDHVGLVGRVGEDYPQEWLEAFARKGFDIRGIRIIPESVELRRFVYDSSVASNPLARFSQLGILVPKALLGYTPPPLTIDSREKPTPLTLRGNDLLADYLEATAAHLAPMDYLSHAVLPPLLRQGNVTTITLDPGAGYMTPSFWDAIPAIVRDITAFLVSEEKLRSLFEGRSSDPWEMAEALANYGCEVVVVKRGQQGQYVYDHARKKRWIVPAYPVHVVDTTGAGDAFCGGFLAGFRQYYDPLEATLWGNISASLVVEGCGPFYALDALPGLARARLEALRDGIRML
jgi:sugar/nucleoside kinase (ribokinase family)